MRRVAASGGPPQFLQPDIKRILEVSKRLLCLFLTLSAIKTSHRITGLLAFDVRNSAATLEHLIGRQEGRPLELLVASQRIRAFVAVRPRRPELIKLPEDLVEALVTNEFVDLFLGLLGINVRAVGECSLCRSLRLAALLCGLLARHVLRLGADKIARAFVDDAPLRTEIDLIDAARNLNTFRKFGLDRLTALAGLDENRVSVLVRAVSASIRPRPRACGS